MNKHASNLYDQGKKKYDYYSKNDFFTDVMNKPQGRTDDELETVSETRRESFIKQSKKKEGKLSRLIDRVSLVHRVASKAWTKKEWALYKKKHPLTRIKPNFGERSNEITDTIPKPTLDKFLTVKSQNIEAWSTEVSKEFGVSPEVVFDAYLELEDKGAADKKAFSEGIISAINKELSAQTDKERSILDAMRDEAHPTLEQTAKLRKEMGDYAKDKSRSELLILFKVLAKRGCFSDEEKS